MIEPLAAILAFLLQDAELRTVVAGRIAAKHKFGMGTDGQGNPLGWADGAQSIQVLYSAGRQPDLYTANANARLEARCYGASQIEAAQVCNALIALMDRMVRSTVETSQGKALIYFLVPDDSPQFDRDPDINTDMVRLFLLASVARDAVA